MAFVIIVVQEDIAREAVMLQDSVGIAERFAVLWMLMATEFAITAERQEVLRMLMAMESAITAILPASMRVLSAAMHVITALEFVNLQMRMTMVFVTTAVLDGTVLEQGIAEVTQQAPLQIPQFQEVMEAGIPDGMGIADK